MKFPPALALISLVFFHVAVAAGAAPEAGGSQSVAVAHKRLEVARENLTKAVQRIEQDPPSTADLDAAHAAVGMLKDAIDAGAEHEPKDLEYAKAFLAARKELRKHREYVDQRRATVHIHDHRRAIDRALTHLKERARGVEGAEVNAKDFEEARTAAAALKKAIEDARPFAKQDQKFAGYLSDADATWAQQEKSIDERWTQLSVERHRALIEESRRALAAAVGELNKGWSDAQFEAADRATAALVKRLEEGKGFEAKSQSYRAEAERVRAEAAQARKRIDTLLSESGLARLKSELEPAHRDLTAAGRAVRSRNPTADQLAEARTATIVVRKLLEKFQPQASRNQAFGQYVSEVRKTLVEVETTLDQRSLDSARADLAGALKIIERRAPTDEAFEEAQSALMVLEKTLEGVRAKEPAIAKPVSDAKALLGAARATIAKRRTEVDVQRQRAKVEEARRSAAAQIRELSGPNVGAEQIKSAEGAVKSLAAVLEEGAALTKKDREYASYHREVKERIAELDGRIASRKVSLAASAGRAQLSERITEAKSKLDAARQPEGTESDIQAAAQGVEAVHHAIEEHLPLEKQDRGYAAAADRARVELERLKEALELARQAGALRRVTVEALAAGSAHAESAASAGNLRAQKERYEKALALFRSCESEGESRIKENRALASVVVLLDGRPSAPKDVLARCGQRAQTTEQLLKQVVPLIQFEEGPKRFFEKGKVLLAKGEKSESLGQFDECISSGLILQNANPELKDRQFEVAGGSMTLAEVTQQCIHQRRSLRGK